MDHFHDHVSLSVKSVKSDGSIIYDISASLNWARWLLHDTWLGPSRCFPGRKLRRGDVEKNGRVMSWLDDAVPVSTTDVWPSYHVPGPPDRDFFWVWSIFGGNIRGWALFASICVLMWINHPFLMVCTTHLWWLGGWFIIGIPTIYRLLFWDVCDVFLVSGPVGLRLPMCCWSTSFGRGQTTEV